MIRRILIVAIIIIAAVWIFKRLFFTFVNENQGKVDILGVHSPTMDVFNKE